jgi:dGTPase
MEWENLLCTKRLGELCFDIKTENYSDRNYFQRDFDRIVFSSPFRRLQKKTQAIPIPDSDHIHTRLIHSLESSSIGRSLGNLVGNEVIKNKKKGSLVVDGKSVSPDDFASIVAAACLGHDIGNPPFGHSGEDAFSEYFNSKNAEVFLEKITNGKINDLKSFEGNAMGFRILTHSFPSETGLLGGRNLTCATLGAFMKYPQESCLANVNGERASEKKYGFFQTEKEIFTKLAGELGLKEKHRDGGLSWHRHPLAFLTEAADDICYRIIDFEDAFRSYLMDFKEVEKLLLKIIKEDGDKELYKYKEIHEEQPKVAFLRARVINILIHQIAAVFMDKHDEILDGSFDSALINSLPCYKVLCEIKELMIERVYYYEPIVQIEVSGFKVLASLLHTFIQAFLAEDQKTSYELIQSLLPSQYLDTDRQLFDDNYTNIINISQYIASMTDEFAVHRYRILEGIELPHY